MYIGMVMRTKIKEIIATGGKIGMRGDVFFPGGFGCWFVLFISILSSRLLHKFSMNT